MDIPIGLKMTPPYYCFTWSWQSHGRMRTDDCSPLTWTSIYCLGSEGSSHPAPNNSISNSTRLVQLLSTDSIIVQPFRRIGFEDSTSRFHILNPNRIKRIRLPKLEPNSTFELRIEARAPLAESSRVSRNKVRTEIGSAWKIRWRVWELSQNVNPSETVRTFSFCPLIFVPRAGRTAPRRLSWRQRGYSWRPYPPRYASYRRRSGDCFVESCSREQVGRTRGGSWWVEGKLPENPCVSSGLTDSPSLAFWEKTAPGRSDQDPRRWWLRSPYAFDIMNDENHNQKNWEL